jgi:hypothetical protein
MEVKRGHKVKLYTPIWTLQFAGGVDYIRDWKKTKIDLNGVSDTSVATYWNQVPILWPAATGDSEWIILAHILRMYMKTNVHDENICKHSINACYQRGELRLRGRIRL